METGMSDMSGELASAVSLLIVPLMIGSPAQAEVEEERTAAIAIAQQAFQLTPTVPFLSRPIVVDRTAAFSISLTATSQTLQISLVDPVGVRYFVGQAPTATFDSAVFPIDAQTTIPGATYLATIVGPIPGTWSLEVAASAPPPASIDVVMVVMLNNDIRLAGC
jgi:hypothetical protein